LEGSDYTSIQERIQTFVQSREVRPETDEVPSLSVKSAPEVATESGTEQGDSESAVRPATLVEFTGTTGESESGLPFHFSDYLELVDWTGRAIRSDKRGYIPADVPPILTRLGVEADNWIETVRHFRRHFYDYVGPGDILTQHGRAMGLNWLRGVGACRKYLGGGEMPVTV